MRPGLRGSLRGVPFGIALHRNGLKRDAGSFQSVEEEASGRPVRIEPGRKNDNPYPVELRCKGTDERGAWEFQSVEAEASGRQVRIKLREEADFPWLIEPSYSGTA